MGLVRRYAFVYGVTLGVGGLGVQAGNALRALALDNAEVHAIGPGYSRDWVPPRGVVWHTSPASWSRAFRFRLVRRYAGGAQYVSDQAIARFARHKLDQVRPNLCYAFTQVGLEALEWARARGIPGILESPNGHIRAFRDVYVRETRRWCAGRYRGHPTNRMVERVEREYAVASNIRVSSEWTRQSLVKGGVADRLIKVLQQSVDLDRFSSLAPGTSGQNGPLRVCFVGSLDLRKGFLYLIRAIRRLGAAAALELVGATGDRCCRRLLERESCGLPIVVSPGNPRLALARAEVFVLPTLEDGSPFAAAEAMASGLPVVTTMSTGAAEWIQPGRSGWVVQPASEESISRALEEALSRRRDLPQMGRLAREDTERRIRISDEALLSWVQSL
jgi:glycosyltransferase involved in cell wall biosynthesis